MPRRSVQIRPAGGAGGCLAMVAFSIAASVLTTVALNVLLR